MLSKAEYLVLDILNYIPCCVCQVLGESMAGISQHCKTGDVLAFGECVGAASKALCGLTEAAGQVREKSEKLAILWSGV